MATDFLPIKAYCERHPWPSEPGMRWLIFNSTANGLAVAGAIVRVGGRVLVDEQKFLAWIESHKINPTADAGAQRGAA
ncbi:MAG: hypothetical protein JXR83_02010 [Deltaproteobacteria bacterium]|nr:hypothetical protein [Deltaproteobacteria bacterium]